MTEQGTYRKVRRPLTAGRALRYGRIAAAAVMLAAVTLPLTVSGAAVVKALGWASRIQILPLAVSGALAGIAVQALVTLTFGRIYCSVVCPLGTVQDIAARLPRAGRKNPGRPWRYQPPRTPLRRGILAVTAAGVICPIAAITAIADPYSAYARFVTGWLRPAIQWLGGEEVVAGSILAAATAAAVMAAVSAIAWREGRTVCNTVCPAGTFLGLFSRYSLLHIDIDTDLCVNCRKCEHACKGHCIDMNDHTVDGSRCVMCFDCTAVCPEGAISYTSRRKRLALPMMQRIAAAGSAAANTINPNNPSRNETIS